jgi:hypothetical protein
MTTFYIIQKPVHRPGMNVLLEFAAADEAEARAFLSNFIYSMLEADDSGKHREVHFTRTADGKWLQDEIAQPTPEDTIDALPTWFKGPGIYNESDALVMAADEQNIDQITLSDWHYYFTNEAPISRGIR